jgi:Flp pilus assembly protein TadG
MTETIFAHLRQRDVRSEPLTRCDRSQHGQAAVEIALLLPILLLILFGIMISGFMFYARIQVSNAVREGTRAGSVYWATHPINGLTLQDTVRKAIYDDKGTVTPSDDVSALGFLPTSGASFNVNTDVAISLLKPDNTAGDLTDPRPGDRLSVSLTYRYTLPIVAVALPMLPQPFVMQSNVMMEIQ